MSTLLINCFSSVIVAQFIRIHTLLEEVWNKKFGTLNFVDAMDFGVFVIIEEV
jgi:hypothetical protein